MYHGRFRFVLLAGLVPVAAAALCAAFYMMAVSPKVETRIQHDAPLTASSTVAEVQARIGSRPQSATGAQVAPQIAEGCPNVDIYPVSDGAVLVCHA